MMVREIIIGCMEKVDAFESVCMDIVDSHIRNLLMHKNCKDARKLMMHRSVFNAWEWLMHQVGLDAWKLLMHKICKDTWNFFRSI